MISVSDTVKTVFSAFRQRIGNVRLPGCCRRIASAIVGRNMGGPSHNLVSFSRLLWRSFPSGSTAYTMDATSENVHSCWRIYQTQGGLKKKNWVLSHLSTFYIKKKGHQFHESLKSHYRYLGKCPLQRYIIIGFWCTWIMYCFKSHCHFLFSPINRICYNLMTVNKNVPWTSEYVI